MRELYEEKYRRMEMIVKSQVWRGWTLYQNIKRGRVAYNQIVETIEYHSKTFGALSVGNGRY